MPDLRIGQGVDVHKFVEGRKLILAGVEIPFHLGLDGHSDADVILHAVTDSVLGALGWGDIGKWFPDTDDRYKNIDSRELFTEVWQRARALGWSLVNCDVTVLAQKPRLSCFIDRMRLNLASLFSDVETSSVSVKATTTETLGFVGREEGILATAVVLLSRN